MKNLKNTLLLAFGLSCASISAQTIDSASVVSYDGQTLEVYAEGTLITIENLITSIQSSAANDSVFIDMRFKPCGVPQTMGVYDTLMQLPITLSEGQKVVELYALFDHDPNPNCLQSEDTVDVEYLTLNVPLNILENPGLAIELYPNPSSGLIHIENRSGRSIERIEVINYLGQLVKTFHQTSNGLDLTDMPKGGYLLKFEVDRISKVERVFIR